MQGSPTEYKRWERISGIEDTRVGIDTSVKENTKCKKFLNTKHPGNLGLKVETKPKILGIEESEDSQFKRAENIFNKIIEDNFPNLKKEMAINVQEAYRMPIRLDQK